VLGVARCRGDPGRQAHLGADPALPCSALTSVAVISRSTRRLPGYLSRNRRMHRAYRRGDGGPHRRAGRAPHDLRHVQAVDRGMTMEDIRLLEKRGGKSGNYVA